MSAQLVECSFFVPIRRDAELSDGELHSVDAWEWLDDELFEHFGGRTLAPGLFDGFYIDPDSGARIQDQLRKYIVAVPEDGLPHLRTLLREVREVFRQKCIYLSVAGRVEII